MSATTPIKFNFKSRTLKDDNGTELGKTKKQAPIIANLITPTKEELVQVLSSEDVAYQKVQQLIMDAVIQIQKDQARSQLDDIIESFGTDDSKVVTPEMLDHDKLTLTYISNLEPAQRGARALSDEDKEAFYADYLQVMVQATGKEEKRIKAHIDLFQKPIKAKQNKDSTAIMTTLVDQINVYLTASQQVEDTGEAALRIQSRFQKWLKEDDAFDASAL
jgi:hypothetical protein